MVALEVKKFTEKPNLKKAKKYLQARHSYWNSGIFAWRISTIIKALKRYAPVLYRGLEDYLRTEEPEVFSRLPSISIDYQVMEKASPIALVKAVFRWDDVGSWDALARHYPRDSSGNTVLSRFVGINTRKLDRFFGEKVDCLDRYRRYGCG